jgi:hypothetical protein
VADLRWEHVSCFFDPDLMGSLPNLRVPDASAEDWQALLDLFEAREWRCEYPEGETVLSRSTDAECPDLRLWPTADVLVIFRLLADDEIDFDVDLRELQGQERLDVFCGFLGETAALGQAGAAGSGGLLWPLELREHLAELGPSGPAKAPGCRIHVAQSSSGTGETAAQAPHRRSVDASGPVPPPPDRRPKIPSRSRRRR